MVTGFAAALSVGTLLLVLPVASTGAGSASFVDSLFTATSAICVTGLTTVDTPEHWTAFGHVVIMVLIQIGGIGIMALATLLALLVSRRLGLRMRLNTTAETKSLALGDVRRVLVGVARTSLVFEAAGAAVLAASLLPLPRRVAGPCALARRLPRGLRVQQRRLRALQRQPGGLLRRPVHPAAPSACW